MKAKHMSPQILFPGSINEVMDLVYNEQKAMYWAGGTAICSEGQFQPGSGFQVYQGSGPGLLPISGAVISLGQVEELSRALLLPHKLEIGSMVRLERLLTARQHIMPTAIKKVLSLFGNHPLLNRATIGGNISTCRGDLIPILILLETEMEIRFRKLKKKRRSSVNSLRKISLSQFIEEKGTGSGELISKFSIPIEPWDYTDVQKIYRLNTGLPLLFCGLARLRERLLEECRIAFWNGSGTLLRSLELEDELSGVSLPLNDRTQLMIFRNLQLLTSDWNGEKGESNLETSLYRLVTGFLSSAHRYMISRDYQNVE